MSQVRAASGPALFVIGFFTAVVPARAQTPDLRIECFGASRAYAVGTEPLTLVGTVRNAGHATVPAGALSPRLFLLAGMEYGEGDTSPRLPELAPGQTAVFRWRVTPLTAGAPLVASFALLAQGQPPVVRVAAIPHLAESPPSEPSATAREPTAWASRSAVGVENSRVRVRVTSTTNDVPVLILSCSTAGGWRRVGTSVPVAQTLSGEPGQRPWWQVFKHAHPEVFRSKDEATLALTGKFGLWWKGVLTLTVHAGSAAVDVALKLTPLRPMQLGGLRLAPLLAGDGSFGSASTETLPPQSRPGSTVTAVRWGNITVGAVRPVEGPFPSWDSTHLPVCDSVDFRPLEVEYHAAGQPALVNPGNLVVTRARLFAFCPSTTVRDSLKVYLPGKW